MPHPPDQDLVAGLEQVQRDWRADRGSGAHREDWKFGDPLLEQLVQSDLVIEQLGLVEILGPSGGLYRGADCGLDPGIVGLGQRVLDFDVGAAQRARPAQLSDV